MLLIENFTITIGSILIVFRKYKFSILQIAFGTKDLITTFTLNFFSEVIKDEI